MPSLRLIAEKAKKIKKNKDKEPKNGKTLTGQPADIIDVMPEKQSLQGPQYR